MGSPGPRAGACSRPMYQGHDRQRTWTALPREGQLCSNGRSPCLQLNPAPSQGSQSLGCCPRTPACPSCSSGQEQTQSSILLSCETPGGQLEALVPPAGRETQPHRAGHAQGGHWNRKVPRSSAKPLGILPGNKFPCSAFPALPVELAAHVYRAPATRLCCPTAPLTLAQPRWSRQDSPGPQPLACNQRMDRTARGLPSLPTCRPEAPHLSGGSRWAQES